MSVRNLRLVVAATTLSLAIAGCSAGSDREVGQAPAFSPNSPEVRYESVDEILDKLEAEFGCFGESTLFTRTYIGMDYTEQYGFCVLEPIGVFGVKFYEDPAGFEYSRLAACAAGKAAGTSSITDKEIWGENWVVFNKEGVTEVSNNRLQKVVGGDIVTPFDGC
jgi:hypothetical protein